MREEDARTFLEICRERFQFDQVLVTCDIDNEGSIRTIEKNGGVLRETKREPDWEKPLRKYWIQTGG
jgi:predicted acetyltransferase